MLTFQIYPIYTMGNEQATIIWFVDNDEVIQECLGGFSAVRTGTSSMHAGILWVL